MKNEVRLSRKEQKRRDRVLDQQRPEAPPPSKSATIRSFADIYKNIGVTGVADIKKAIDALLVEYRDGDIDARDYARRIFDPKLLSLTELPIGLLDHKEEALPPELLPADPDGKQKLRALCERMIIRSQDPKILELVLEGWPGSSKWNEKLDGHVNDLWHLRQADWNLYRAIVCGQHGEVLLRMRRKTPPAGFSDGSLIRMLVRHGLLWCTNDIQLILARNVLAMRNPFGALLSTDFMELDPSRIVNDLPGHFMLLRLCLDLYVTTAAAAAGQQEPATVPKDPIATDLKLQISHHAQSSNIDLMTHRTRLDEIMPHVRAILSEGKQWFGARLDQPVTAKELNKTFHGIWFSGLTNLQSAAVPLLRYVQAEAQLDGMIRALLPLNDVEFKAREGTALPEFNDRELPVGSIKRVKSLHRAYLHALFEGPIVGKSDNAGDKAIKGARTFLRERGERLIHDHAGDKSCPRRTYYLLDIIPEARLHRRFGMTRYPSALAGAA